MNKEVYVNIKISMPNGSDMSFSDEEIKEIQDYYEKEFSNFDYLVGEINVSFVDEKTKQIDQLKQQLAEKDARIADLEDKDWYEACIKQLEEQNNRLIDTLEEKDKEIKSLIADYEKRISQEQELMSNMEHQLIEKQNTIDEINKEFVQAIHDWKTLCAKKDNEISKLQASYQQVKAQLAIQELEKVKDFILENTMLETETAAVLTYIYQQIKELKGEK